MVPLEKGWVSEETFKEVKNRHQTKWGNYLKGLLQKFTSKYLLIANILLLKHLKEYKSIVHQGCAQFYFFLGGVGVGGCSRCSVKKGQI